MTMTELSRFLMVSNGNVTGIVDRLVAEGMVVRLAHEGDRRATFVRLTPKGAQQFEAMAKAHEAWVDEILAGFSSERHRDPDRPAGQPRARWGQTLPHRRGSRKPGELRV